jgi:RNA polymerase sigma-70 factor (ECF subfamily)
MLTITRYTAIDRLRKEQRQPTDLSVPLEDEQATSDDMPWQDNRIMRALLDQLPGEQQRVIDLAFYQGMTHSEMASYLSLPLGTVKTRLRLGLQKLRDLWLDSVNS